MALFGGGATLAGLMLGAIAVFVIDRQFERAAIYCGIAAVLAFFGFINGTALGWDNSGPVALGYLVLAAVVLTLRPAQGEVMVPMGEAIPPAAVD